MAKSVQSVKNSLKFKTQPVRNVVSVRVGVKKFAVPVQARMLSADGYMFLSIQACSELFRVENKQLVPMGPEEDASDAYALLNPGKKRSKRKVVGTQLPAGIEAALKDIPAGYRLGYDAEGRLRLVRTRVRKKKG